MTTLTTGRHSTSTIAWRFTTCTSTKSSTELAHVVLFLAHFITLTLAQVRALSALHSRPSSWPFMWLLSLRLDFLFLPLRLPPVLLPLPLLPPHRRAAAGAQQEDHGKTCATPPTTGVRAPITSSTSPQVEEKAGRHIDDFLVTRPKPNVERFLTQAGGKLNMQDSVLVYKTATKDF